MYSKTDWMSRISPEVCNQFHAISSLMNPLPRVQSHCLSTWCSLQLIGLNLSRGDRRTPHCPGFLLLPIPQELFDRSLVLDPVETVELMLADGPSAAAMVDGSRKVILEPGDLVRCTVNGNPAHLVTFANRDFHQILKKKFGLHSKRMGE